MEINPKDTDASKLLAQILIKEGNFEQAKTVVEEALDQSPYSGDLYYFLANTTPNDKNTKINNLKKALENHRTLTINPNQIKNELKMLKI